MQLVTDVDSLDVQTFQFKRQRKIQVFKPTVNLPSNRLDLLAAVSRFGLLFIGSPDKTLNVFQISDVIEGNGVQCPRRIINLPSIPLHISVNCDNELLCVVLHKNNALVAVIYDTRSFVNENLTITKEIQLIGSTGVQLSSLVWNPCISDSLAVCLSDGSLSIFQCKLNSIELQTKMTNACCLSWSPKGKQIVTGNSDGTLNQYKPDLTLVKNIPAPHLYDNNTSLQVLAIHWISNYQFNVVYNNPSDPEYRACVTIINTPKGGTNTCINYEDICYSMGSSRDNQFFLIHLALWGVILTSSANSMEIGVLGTKDQANWQQWIQMDEGRAELPLTDDKQENYPIGICFDNASTVQLPWGDAATLPFMPMVHILSHTGALVTFFAINVEPTAPPLCQTPEFLRIPQNLLALENPSAMQAPAQPPAPVSNPSQDFSFAISQNTITSTPTLPKADRSNFGLINSIAPNKLFSSITNDIKSDNNIPQFGDVKNQQININVLQQPNTVGTTESFNPDFSQSIKPQGLNILPKSTVTDFSIENIQKPMYSEKQKNNIPTSGDKSYKPEIPTAPSNSTLMEMLLKEINDYQMEQFELMQRCYNINTKIGTDEEMTKLVTLLSNCKMDPLNDLWSDEEIKKQMVLLKQSLISTCAFIAEAKLQPIPLEIEQLVQLDPVSAGKMSSIKLNSYYIESQLKQIKCVLNEQKKEFENECVTKAKALHGVNNADNMKIPTLDKIYQPLLQQSEILAKQQFIVATLEKKIEQLNLSNNLNSLKNKSLIKLQNIPCTPMSRLSNDLLNMSLQSELKPLRDPHRDREVLEQKNDELRKLLNNYKTVKIRPTKIEPTSMMQSFYNWESDKLKNEKSNLATQQKVNDTNIKNVVTDSISSTKSNDAYQQSVKAVNPLTNLNNFVANLSPQDQSSFLKYAMSTQFNEINSVAIAKLKENQTQEFIADKIKFEPPKSKPAEIVSSTPVNNTAFSINKIFPTSSNTTVAPTFGSFQFSQASQPSPFSISTPPKTAPVTVPPPDVIKITQTYEKVIFQPPQPVNTISSIKNPNDSIVNPTPNPTSTATSKNVAFNFQIAAQTKQSPFSFTSPNPSDVKPTVTSTAAPAVSTAASSILTSNSNVTPNKNVTLSFNFNPNKSLQSDTTNLGNALVSPKPVITDPATIFKNANIPISNTSTISKPVDTSLPKSEITIEKFNVSLENSNATKNVESVIKSPNVTITSNTPVSDAMGKINQTSVPSATISTTTTSNEKNVVPETITFPTSNKQDSTPKPLFGFNITPNNMQVNVTQTTTPTVSDPTPSSIFGSPTQQTAAVGGFFDSANKSPTSVFGANPVTSTPSIFGATTPVNTCASSLFGAANAAIDTNVSSLFGNTSISATPPAAFGNMNPTSGSAFNGGNVFGGRPSFGGNGESTFGNNTFGQQPSPSSIFGGGSGTFGGGFGATQPSTQTASIFGQAAQTNTFGGNAAQPQHDLFGGNALAKNTFGSPAAAAQASPQQNSIFGGGAQNAAPVFGGSPTFGSKAVFGQPTGFGSPPAFGAFGATDQPSVAQSGFGSPSSFGKPTGGFGGSPKFGSSPTFGATPSFGASPTFGNNVAKFGGSPGMQSGFGGGTQQSSTFETLATQSGLSFGNLAQQSQQPAPAPAFQGSSSFSTWR